MTDTSPEAVDPVNIATEKLYDQSYVDAIRDTLSAQLTALQRAQPYNYIGRDGKAVLARDLEDRVEHAEAQLTAALAAVEQAEAAGYVQGLHDSAHRYQSMAGPDSWDCFQEAEIAMLALIPAGLCDTKSAENVTQAGLCQSDAQQSIKPTPAPAGNKGGTE